MPSQRWTPKPTKKTGNARVRKWLNAKIIPLHSHTGKGNSGGKNQLIIKTVPTQRRPQNPWQDSPVSIPNRIGNPKERKVVNYITYSVKDGLQIPRQGTLGEEIGRLQKLLNVANIIWRTWYDVVEFSALSRYRLINCQIKLFIYWSYWKLLTYLIGLHHIFKKVTIKSQCMSLTACFEVSPFIILSVVHVIKHKQRKMFLCLRHMPFLIFVCQNVGLRRTVQHVFFALPLPWTSRYHMNIVYHAVALPIYIF